MARGRRVPLFVSIAFVVVSMQASLWWYDIFGGSPGVWRMPGDFWTTFLSSVALVHGHFSAIYSSATGLVTLPGISFLLAPVAALTSGLGWHLGPPAEGFWSPVSWLLAGTVMLALSTLPIFAADRLAEGFGLSERRRLALALSEAIVLANVSLLWGHPEDAASVGLVLYAVVAARAEAWKKAAVLLGVAMAVQPLALLAVPAVLAPLGTRQALRHRWRPVVAALVLPALAVSLLPLVAEPATMLHALVDQPNYPSFNHATPWTSLAPHLANGGVGSGPTRALVTIGAWVGGVWNCRRRSGAERVLLVIGGAFAARVLFEVVVADFYVWPALAVLLVLAARLSAWRLGAAFVVAAGESWFQQQRFGGVWPWWLMTMGLLGVMLVLAVPFALRPRPAVVGLRAAGSSELLS